MHSLIKPFASQNFLIGIGLAAAAYFVGPALKEAIKPAAVKGAQGMLMLGDKAKDALNIGKEKLNDLIFDKEDKSVNMEAAHHDKIIKALKEERELSNKILEELKNTIGGLKDEIAHMRGNVQHE
ncbi:MAG: hypothetical protein N2489_03630 [Clostridia bacterium]|nr:hypothetical protein [Clostridia bacterium]